MEPSEQERRREQQRQRQQHILRQRQQEQVAGEAQYGGRLRWELEEGYVPRPRAMVRLSPVTTRGIIFAGFPFPRRREQHILRQRQRERERVANEARYRVQLHRRLRWEFKAGHAPRPRARVELGEVRDIIFAGLPFPLNPQARHPLLLESHGGRALKKQTFYTPTTLRVVDNYNIFEFYKKEASPVSPVSDGWISLVDSKDRLLYQGASCCLLNTFTKQLINLPPIKYKGAGRGNKYYDCVLSKPTSDPECRFIFVSTSDLQWCRAGDARFEVSRHTGYTDYITSLVNFKGTVYGLLGESRDVVEVTFVGFEMRFSHMINNRGQHCNIPNQETDEFLETDGYFIDCCGDLLYVQMLILRESPNQTPKFVVFEVDLLRKECSRVSTIGGRAVFVPGGLAVRCEEEEVEITKDTIYFLWRMGCMWAFNIALSESTSESTSTRLFKKPGSHLSWLNI